MFDTFAERGKRAHMLTTEYNLALGSRRAEAVRRYLVALGADPKKIKVVSYGEERPADPGHNEAAWAKNRRAEIILGDAR
jgi:peptidoglycan-associated lipoprotein